MEKDTFLLVDRLKEISASFVKDGWITVYESVHKDMPIGDLIYSCVVHANHLSKYLKNRDWGIHHGREGKPSVFSTFKKGKEKMKYEAFGEKGLEPFLFYRFFSHNKERYIDIS